MRKKLLTIMLIICMILTLLPVYSIAATEDPFTDVSSSDYYYKAVNYVYENDLMKGIGNDKFAPNQTVSRGMILTTLYRLEGTPAVVNSMFTDVAADAYYADAIAWSAQNNIVLGYGNGKFGPEDSVTREQLAAILYRYAQYKDYDVSDSANLSDYTDINKISAYAVPAMKWANKMGLVKGTSTTVIAPQDNATRGQIAEILYRFCNEIADRADTYTVTFVLNYKGADADKNVFVQKGKTISAPTAPSRDGYSFNGWYTAATGGDKFNFTTAITADVTLYAHWSVKSSGGSSGGSTPADTTPPIVSDITVGINEVHFTVGDATKVEIDANVGAQELDVTFTKAELEALADELASYGVVITWEGETVTVAIADYSTFIGRVPGATAIDFLVVAYDAVGNASGHMGLADGTPATAKQATLSLTVGVAIVYNAEELNDALTDDTIGTIQLGADIELSAPVKVTRTVIINGNGKEIRYASTSTDLGGKNYVICVGGAAPDCTLTLNEVSINENNNNSMIAVAVTEVAHEYGTLIANNVEFTAAGTDDAYAVQVGQGEGAVGNRKVQLTTCTANITGGHNGDLAANSRGYVLGLNGPLTVDSSISSCTKSDGMFDLFTVAGLTGDKPFMAPYEGMLWRDQGTPSVNKVYKNGGWVALTDTQADF